MISIHPLTDKLIGLIEEINESYGHHGKVGRYYYRDIERKLFKSGEDDGYRLYLRLQGYLTDINLKELNKLDEIVQQKNKL